MNILMSGSGSGGHINPCISLYKYLSSYYKIYIVIFKKIDKKIYDMNNISYYYIDDKLSVKDKIIMIKKFMNNQKIGKTLTFGGKNSFYINLVAKMLKKKIYIFEQNVILGKANKINYLLCNKIFTNFIINLKKEINVGNPNTFNLKPNKVKLFNNNKKTLLFTMGSLGSSTIDKVIVNFIKTNKDYNVIYVLGNNVNNRLSNKDNLIVFDYYNPLTDLINYADIIISRAGASTLSEIIYFNKPSIIIPSPYVTDDHQSKNALAIKKENGCIVIKEKELSVDLLNYKIHLLANNKKYYKNMKKNLLKLDKGNNFSKIKDVLMNDNI